MSQYNNVVEFAINHASQSGRNVRICVPNKSSPICEDFLSQVFDGQIYRAMRNKKQLISSGVKIGLFSSQTLRKEHILLDAVYLVTFPNAELLNVIESHGRKATVIVFGTLDGDTDVLDSWAQRYQPKPMNLA
ncbi:hypothetical protein [Pantoea phytobeneficialis]|uniref:Uncharacterized protein n=1 Tax=Pantoea phytobeneficialis TaxID=2052056 RepID=A0ABT8XTV0_9GAMM|nr:hypothetical protein [Pantoea phytobeneficialis]MDO6406870.1 hypothetical protein [Pantoea phytobeneficialis]